MSYDNNVQIVGNLVQDIDVKFTSAGKPYANFTVAVNKEINGEKMTSYFDCTLWGEAATNASASVHKGDRVMVFGGLTQRSFERKDGSKGSAVELRVSEVGPSLTWATATVTKAPRA
jgi:single-strand DNA-binding protein